ncbi:MAG TPA: hypothetical protein VM533_09500, partial [Fimbriiglobus sp.]|nr:hypothetical protein [Fimbriiglobus sp.]
MVNSSKRPLKPYPEFPLYAHPMGYWAKKVRGTIHYFGRWGRMVGGVMTPLEGETWKEALDQYKLQ